MDNRMTKLEEKQHSNHISDIEECNIHLPISTLTGLISFEDQLQETQFKDKVVCNKDFLFLLYYNIIEILIRFFYKVISQFNVFDNISYH